MAKTNSPQTSGVISQMLKLAVVYCETGKGPEAEKICRQVLKTEPDNPDAFHVLGVLAAKEERYDEAIGFFREAIRLKKDFPPFHYHLALAFQKRGETSAAEEEYRRVIALEPENISAHSSLGALYMSQKQWDKAVAALERVIEIKPDCAEAYSDLGVVLKKLNRREEAKVLYMKAVIFKPDYAMARFNLANTLLDEGQYADAMAQYARAILLKPDFFDAYINLGETYKRQGQPEKAAEYYAQALAIRPHNDNALSSLVHARQHICDWDGLAAQEEELLDMARQGAVNIPPFSFLGLPSSSAERLACTQSYLRGREEAHPARVFSHRPPRAQGKIRLGYLSADFYPHATTFLMAELFERHDRSRFEVAAYSYGREDKGAMRDRLLKGFDRFIDMRLMTDDQAAQKIYDDGVDILIDIKGYTTGGRVGIPARRPAPVQVNYLGYPGTMGGDFIDYIVGDPFVLPFGQQAFFSEKIVQLPDCYQPNDTTRTIAPTPARADCGLPEEGFVFCCFNNTYKITPLFFDIWARLLKAVPGSVLWLLEANLGVKENLRREAQNRGIDPARLVFAPRKQLPEHLARHRCADLFLDTLPVNAHTTTSDALWAGLPVLTCAGKTFAGRVAGSLLTSIGLPELITTDIKEYEALALQLVQDPLRLAALREKLEKNRLTTPLFDIKRLVGNLENAYETMWNIWQKGAPPRAFKVGETET